MSRELPQSRWDDNFDILGVLFTAGPEIAAMSLYYFLINLNLFNAAVAGVLAGAMARLGLGVVRRLVRP